jgi:thiamine-monophosphate kinase
MIEQGNNKNPISNLGKYGLIDHLTKDFGKNNRSSVLLTGDDSAVIDSGQGLTLVTSDLLLEGIHFNLVYTPLKHLGYKSVIRAISDIYAMNGTPGQLIVSLGISSRFSVEECDEIYSGISLACDKYGLDLAGGDLASSITGLSICVTAIGSVAPDNLVKRSGARLNDLICVTGDLGASYMGLQLLERERRLFENDKSVQPVLTGNEYIIGRQLRPEFPAGVLDTLSKENILPTSMIDVSEGLASDILQLCKSSGSGCKVFSSEIPVADETIRMAEEFRIDPMIPALNGGEDYELLFTVPLGLFDAVRLIDSVSIIGHITGKDEGTYLIGNDGEETELVARGWK